jgi:hypothetical protein
MADKAEIYQQHFSIELPGNIIIQGSLESSQARRKTDYKKNKVVTCDSPLEGLEAEEGQEISNERQAKMRSARTNFAFERDRTKEERDMVQSRGDNK